MTLQQTQLNAAEWLERRQHQDWSAEDQAAFDTWLADSGNMVAYLRIESVWQRAARLTVLRQPQSQSQSQSQSHAQSGLQSNLQPMRRHISNSHGPRLRKIAGGFILAALVGALAWYPLNAPAEETYVTAIGGHKLITFKDGTRVELNTDTVLRVSKKSGERKVWLDKGEAYFEVEHDADRPFVVVANGRRITDLGTKFAVRQDEKLQVSVVEGLVEVEAKNNKPQSLLKPGDILTATAQAQSVAQKPLRTIRASLGWKHGQLIFVHATLAEAAAEFNRYNTRKLVIDDPSAAALTVVGTFHTKNIDTFTKVAKEIFGLKAEKKNDEIILSQ